MRRLLLWTAYAGYLLAVGYLVWDPRPTVPSSAVTYVTDLLNRIGPDVASSTVEFILNVVLFVPMSLLGTFVFRRLRVADWVLVGFLGSFAIEVVQRFFLPGRDGSSRDIVANTAGALIGALLARLFVSARDARGRRTPVPPSEVRSG